MSDDAAPEAPGELTLDQAADKFAALDDSRGAPPPAAPASEAPTLPEPTTPDEAPEDAPPEPEFDIDGRKLKQSELIEAYRKTQAPAQPAQPQQGDAALQEAARLAKAAAAYEQNLQALIQAQTPNFEKLLDENPQEFLKAQYRHHQQMLALQQAQSHRQEAEAQQRQHFEAELQRTLQTEAEKLSAAVPEWKDETVAKTERNELTSYLQKLGYTPDVLNGIADHREVLIARKAMLYDKMVAEQKRGTDQLQEKLNKLPPPRIERPGRGDTTRSPSDEAKSRLRRTGSLDDAARAFAALNA